MDKAELEEFLVGDSIKNLIRGHAWVQDVPSTCLGIQGESSPTCQKLGYWNSGWEGRKVWKNPSSTTWTIWMKQETTIAPWVCGCSGLENKPIRPSTGQFHVLVLLPLLTGQGPASLDDLRAEAKQERLEKEGCHIPHLWGEPDEVRPGNSVTQVGQFHFCYFSANTLWAFPFEFKSHSGSY